MVTSQGSWKSSRKNIVALVYLGIALVLAVQGVAMTWAHVQFFDSMGTLEVRVESLTLNLDDGAGAVIHTTIQNPKSFTGMRLWSITYVLFVNSTTENFSLQGGTNAGEFGVRELSFEQEQKMIPPRDTLSITYTLLPHPEVVDPLRSFYSRHTNDLKEFVGVTLTLVSSFGFIEIPHCYEFPQNVFTICPGLEVPPRTRFG